MRILIIILLILFLPKSQVYPVEREQPLDVSEFGSFAETIAKELPAAISFEEYERSEARAKNIVRKKEIARQSSLVASNLSATLNLIAQIRERFRKFELYKAEVFNRPIRAAGVRKSVHADGSVTYSGTNSQIAKYILKKYGPEHKDVDGGDIQDLINKLDETKGRFAHKRFSITFGTKQEDKLENITKIPFSFSLTNESTFFPEWSYTKALSPKYAQDKDGKEFVLDELTYTFTKYDPNEFHGQWYAFNDKESNAFSYSTGYFQKIINKNTGLVTEVNQKVLEMDLDKTREPLEYARTVKEYDLYSNGDLYTHTYKETVEVLNYYNTFDSEGKSRYLAKELLVTRLDDNQKPNAITKSYISYNYDENNRVDKSLVVTNTNVDGTDIDYNTISITDNSLFDPLTGLSLIENDKVNIPQFKGSFEDAKKYGKAIWRTINDEDLVQFKNGLGEKDFISKISKDIASLVVWGNYDYNTPKEMILEEYKGEKLLSSANWIN
jgi:hypothetical protein